MAAGRHREAAAALVDGGRFAEAADIYERVWAFAEAADAARRGGDLPRALRCTLEARDDDSAADLTAALRATPDGTTAALAAYTAARRWSAAADLALALGEPARDRAIDLLSRAHRDLEAAALLEEAGRDRDAGLLLERVLGVADGEDAAAAHLALGRILARRGAMADAARHLQDATRSPTLAGTARRQLVMVLATMDLRDAARDVLTRTRADEPELTADLDAFLRDARAREPVAPVRERELLAGRYRIERPLGAGAAGRVVLAYDEVAGRQVAVKIIHAAGAHGGAAHERFRREAQITSALKHPSLVETYDVAFEQGILVMEYLPGGSLAQRLAGGELLTEAAVRRLGLELAAALEAAHARGVVHRDLKPANVFFDGRGTAKLGDFGVAHIVDLGQTQTGGLIGTLAYMSPEQITGAPISVAADVYGLGVTLFEALAGRLPLLGPDFVAQHLGELPPPVATVRADLAPGWTPLLAAMLQKAPSDRPTLAAVRRDLEAIAVGRAVVGTPAVGAPVAGPVDDAPEAPEDSRGERGGERYTFETAIGRTPHSRLTRAVDRVLDRSVIIERFEPGPVADARLAFVRAAAAASSPFVQRALAMDRDEVTAVFEAPAGAPWSDAAVPTRPRERLRLLKRLARGLTALHAGGVTHGAVSATAIVVDDGAIPTLLIAGLPPPHADAAPAADVAAVIALVAADLGAPTWSALVQALAPGASLDVALGDGAALYAALDELELAHLRARAS